MNRSLLLVAFVLAAAAAVACGRTDVLPLTCRQITCPSGFECDPSNGECRPSSDPDGSVDAGPSVDAGLPADAGMEPCPDGCAAPLFCDPEANQGAGACVLCTETKGCGGMTPFCDRSTPGGVCVGCRDNADCTASAPACQPKTNTCVGCVTNTDCANPTPICRNDAATCVPCQKASQCGAGHLCRAGQCQIIPDTCATAADIVFPTGSQTAKFEADTTLASDDETGTCHPNGGPELVYRLSLSQVTDVKIHAQSAQGAPARPVIYLRKAPCSGGAQVACSFTGANNQSLQLSALEPGDYFLFVEADHQTGARVNVTVTLSNAPTPPANDVCINAQPLVFTNGTATATGTTVNASNGNTGSDPTPTCSSSAKQTGADVVYSYTLATAQDVTVKVTPTGPGSNFVPVVYVRSANCASTSPVDEQGCQTSFTPSTQTLQLQAQQPGTYYVWVDGGLQTSGTFQLDVTLGAPSTPPSNDSCPGTALSFNNNFATASGSTALATNGNSLSDAIPSCSTSARVSGRDVVYSYTLTQSQNVTITVAPTTAGYFPAFYVKKTGCGVTQASNEVACEAAMFSGPVSTTLVNQPAGTYWVWVDGLNGTSGDFQFAVNLTPATVPPGNDTCAAPQTLAIGTIVSGDTTNSADNFSTTSSPAYGSACTTNHPYPFTGRDLVYQFTATSTSHTVTVTPAVNFDPALLLLQPSCSASSCLVASDNIGGGVAETLVLTTMPGQVYYLVVDAWDSSKPMTSGTFTITVQ